MSPPPPFVLTVELQAEATRGGTNAGLVYEDTLGTDRDYLTSSTKGVTSRVAQRQSLAGERSLKDTAP